MTTPLKAIGLEDWKTKAKAGDAPTECLLRKGFDFDQVSKLEDSPEGLLRARFVISMGTLDRDNDVIELGGWDTSDYLKNPQVLWSHDYYGTPVPGPDGIGLPTLGLAAELTFAGDKMVSVVEFQPKELNPLAHTIAQLVLHVKRFIRAASVGFKPVKYAWNTDRFGVDFFKQLLLEWSICPIGSHPDALSEAKSFGIDMTPIRDWASRVLDCIESEPGFWIPKSQVEHAYRLVAGTKVIGIPALAFKGIDADDVRQVLSGPVELHAADGTVLRTLADAVVRTESGAEGGAAEGAAAEGAASATEGTGTTDTATEQSAADGQGSGAADQAAADAAGAAADGAGEAAAEGKAVAGVDAAVENFFSSEKGVDVLAQAMRRAGISPATAAAPTGAAEVQIDPAILRQAAGEVVSEYLAPLQGALTSATGRLD